MSSIDTTIQRLMAEKPVRISKDPATPDGYIRTNADGSQTHGTLNDQGEFLAHGAKLAYQISVNMTLTLDHAPAMHGEQVKAAVAMMWQTMREQRATAAGETYVANFADGNIVFQVTPIVEVEVPSGPVAEQPAQVQ